jgi:hypothetical protein
MYDITTDKMLSVTETAECLGLNDQVVRAKCRDGVLPAVQSAACIG